MAGIKLNAPLQENVLEALFNDSRGAFSYMGERVSTYAKQGSPDHTSRFMGVVIHLEMPFLIVHC